MKKVHECEKMKLVESWIECDEDHCSLYINHVASEADLEENHYLEYAGQTIDNVSIDVLFCPYCGVKLLDEDSGFCPSFSYNDFSRHIK